jgi:hydroxymethylpyrimidine kinase/phosphomethylpyrimidine kinase/thiamine-phosphate diphosphorylase
MAWRDVTSDDVPDLWFGRRLDVRFVPLVAPIGVYPIVARAAEMPALVAAGVRMLQLRVKDLSGTALKNEIRAAVALAGSATQLFVNDYWREALELGAYGVHLGQEDLDTADLEAIAASGLRLGISTHSYAEAARAKSLSPSYIALGPIKPTTCKSMRFGPQGMPRIAEWRRLFAAPLVAIGGLKREDLTEVRALGADGAAVISGIVSAAAPGDAARAWIDTWISSRESD